MAVRRSGRDPMNPGAGSPGAVVQLYLPKRAHLRGSKRGSKAPGAAQALLTSSPGAISTPHSRLHPLPHLGLAHISRRRRPLMVEVRNKAAAEWTTLQKQSLLEPSSLAWALG